jgi:hypothetical protein
MGIVIDMINPLVLVLLGFTIGILTGFFGVGGGFLVTPALNIFGLHMVHAIGTGFFVIVGNTLVGAIRHRRLGNVDLKLGIILGLCSIGGVEFGKRLVLHLEKLNLAETYVRVAYIILLTFISMYMVRDSYYAKTRHKEATGEHIGSKANMHTVARHIHRIDLPPTVSLPHAGVGPISIWVIMLSGLLIGFLSGFMGLGGGVIGLPLMIYVIGVPTIIAVGTSLVNVFLISSYGTAIYALTGNVQWVPGLIILGGSIIGVQCGVYATEYVRGMKIKILFALMLFAIAVSVFLKQIDIVTISSYLVGGSACVLSLAILLPLGKKLRAR